MILKKLVTTFLALTMVMSAMCINASAATTQLNVEQQKVVSEKASDSGTCVVPFNPGAGTTGKTIFEFTADKKVLSFTINWKNAGANDTYNYQLWRYYSSGNSTEVGYAKVSSFGAEQKYSDLTIGGTYYLKASSTRVPSSGAECTFSYETKDQ